MAGFNFMDGSGFDSGGNFYAPSTGAGLQAPTTLAADMPKPNSPEMAAYSAPSMDSLSAAPKITLSTANPNTATADGTVAGAGQASKSIQDYIKEATAPETAEQSQANSLTKDLMSLVGQDVGKAQALADEEAKAGVPELTKQLNQLNGEILTGNAEYLELKAQYDKIAVENRGKPITMSSIIGNDAQIKYAQASELNVKASQINLTVARAQALQGNIELAQRTAAKAVDLKYAAIEDQIKVKMTQLELIQPILDKQEKIQALALQRQYEDQKDAIAEEKAALKDNISLGMSAGVTTRFYNYAGEIRNTLTGEAYSTPEQFFKAAGVGSWEEANSKGIITDISQTQATATSSSSGTSDMNEYSLAVSQGFTGTFQQWVDRPSQYKGTSGGSGSGGGGSTTETKAQLAAQAENDIYSYLRSNAGNDGYVSPESWNQALEAWIEDGYLASQFYTKFQRYINPADPQDYR